ncbi:MAG: calcium-binding protein [Hyphomicrobiales bacterium]
MYTQNRGGTDDGSDARMVIDGTFIKTGSASVSTISVAVENNGTISVQSGDLVINKLTGDGTLEVGGTGRLVLNGDFMNQIVNDTLTGSNGTDLINGRNGEDRITGAGGDDTLTGGNDAFTDTSVFDPDFGKDVITDFQAAGTSHDIVEFSTSMFADWDAVEAALSDGAAGAVITLDADNSITFNGVTSAQLIANQADDFRFV